MEGSLKIVSDRKLLRGLDDLVVKDRHNEADLGPRTWPASQGETTPHGASSMSGRDEFPSATQCQESEFV